MVELAIVLLVIGALAAIAIPSISHWLAEYRLGIAAQQVVDSLQATKMAAVAKTRRLELLFDVSGNRVGREGETLVPLPSGVTFSAGDVSVAPDPAVPMGSAVTFPPLDANASLRSAAFTGRGLPDVDPGQVHAVFLSNDSGTMAVLMTSAGNVRIATWRDGEWK